MKYTLTKGKEALIVTQDNNSEMCYTVKQINDNLAAWKAKKVADNKRNDEQIAIFQGYADQVKKLS